MVSLRNAHIFYFQGGPFCLNWANNTSTLKGSAAIKLITKRD